MPRGSLGWSTAAHHRQPRPSRQVGRHSGATSRKHDASRTVLSSTPSSGTLHRPLAIRSSFRQHATSFAGTLELNHLRCAPPWAASTRLCMDQLVWGFLIRRPRCSLVPSTGWPRSSATWYARCGPSLPRPFSLLPSPFSIPGWICTFRPCAAGFPMHTLAASA